MTSTVVVGATDAGGGGTGAAVCVTGFGAGRGYDFEEFLADARGCGLVPDLLLSTWDLRPFTADADFLVAVLGQVTGAPAADAV